MISSRVSYSFCVCQLSVSPKAKGLFQRAIIQSGQCISDVLAPNSPEEGYAQTLEWLAQANYSSLEEVMEAPIPELLQKAGRNFNRVTLDGIIMPNPPAERYLSGDINPKDLIVGSNTVDDPAMLGPPPFAYVAGANQFEPYVHSLFDEDYGVEVSNQILELYSVYGNTVSSYANFNGDYLLRCGARELAAMAANSRHVHVYHYVLSHYSDNDIAKSILDLAGIASTDRDGWSSHTVEVPFVFGNLDYTLRGPAQYPVSEQEERFSKQEVMHRWVEFAKTGIPGTDWEPVPRGLTRESLDTLPSLLLTADQTVAMREFPEKQAQCDSIPSTVEIVPAQGKKRAKKGTKKAKSETKGGKKKGAKKNSTRGRRHLQYFSFE